MISHWAAIYRAACSVVKCDNLMVMDHLWRTSPYRQVTTLDSHWTTSVHLLSPWFEMQHLQIISKTSIQWQKSSFLPWPSAHFLTVAIIDIVVNGISTIFQIMTGDWNDLSPAYSISFVLNGCIGKQKGCWRNIQEYSLEGEECQAFLERLVAV